MKSGIWHEPNLLRDIKRLERLVKPLVTGGLQGCRCGHIKSFSRAVGWKFSVILQHFQELVLRHALLSQFHFKHVLTIKKRTRWQQAKQLTIVLNCKKSIKPTFVFTKMEPHSDLYINPF